LFWFFLFGSFLVAPPFSLEYPFYAFIAAKYFLNLDSLANALVLLAMKLFGLGCITGPLHSDTFSPAFPQLSFAELNKVTFL